jgi:O-antigen ligase
MNALKLIKTAFHKTEDGTMLVFRNNNFSSINLLIFVVSLFLIDILILKTKEGLIIVIATALLSVALLKPKLLYFGLISLFSVETFSPVNSVSLPRIIAILLLMGLGIRLLLTKGAIQKDDSYKYFILFFAGSAVSFIFAKDLLISIKVYVTYISLFLLFVFTRYFLRNEKDIQTALNCLFISTLLTPAIVQGLGLSAHDDNTSRIGLASGDPNEYASFLLVLIPLALHRFMHAFGIKKIFYGSCLIGFLALLVFTGSRGGMLGFLGASGIIIYYYAVKRFRQVLFFCLLVAVIGYFVVPDEFWVRASTLTQPVEEADQSVSHRLDNYKAALKMFADRPLAGVGLYNFKLIGADYGATEGKVVHNTYLEVLTGGGLLSFVPFCLILMSCWRKLRPMSKSENPMRDLLICLKASFVSILITITFLSADRLKILWFLMALISSAYYIALKQEARSFPGGAKYR